MIEFEAVRFAYPGADSDAVAGVTLRVAPGERVVLLGRNGSGKSTMARLANGSATPTSGSVTVDGAPATPREVGFVRQDPTCQLVSALVEDEVAFGPQNLGYAREKVLDLVAGALDACGIADLRGRACQTLSGGQQQLLAMAGVLAMRPSYLVLDEVTSHLDARAAKRVRTLVDTLVAEGMGVLEVGHSIDCVLGATRVAVLDQGRIVWEGEPMALLGSREALELAGWSRSPRACGLCSILEAGLDVSGGLAPDRVAAFVAAHDLPLFENLAPAISEGGNLLALEGVTVSYDGVRALDGVSMAASAGITVVAGQSGSGKTTASRVAAGLLEPDEGMAVANGEAVVPGMVGLSFQRPEEQLVADTVADDIAFGPRNLGLGDAEVAAAVGAAARELGIGEDLMGRSPFSLSGGQMRRVALAGVVAMDPAAFVFDEPTAGLDAEGRADLRALLRRIAQAGKPVVVVTHDVGEWLPVANRIAFLRQGRLLPCADVREAASDPAVFDRAGLEPPFEVVVRGLMREACHG